MEPSSSPADLVASAEALILDFDGPVCDVYAGADPAAIARDIGSKFGNRIGSSDPLDYISDAIASGGPVDEIHEYLATAETRAIKSAIETEGVRSLIESFPGPVAVASNNAAAAIESWLAVSGLRDSIAHVLGRNPRLMKPDPHVLNRISEAIRVRPLDCVFVGDSVSDAVAASAAGMPFIALANKAEKLKRFEGQNCIGVIRSMVELVR